MTAKKGLSVNMHKTQGNICIFVQELIVLRGCLHDTGVTSAVHCQYVLGVLLSGNMLLDIFCCFGCLLQFNQTSDLYFSLKTTISVPVDTFTLLFYPL